MGICKPVERHGRCLLNCTHWYTIFNGWIIYCQCSTSDGPQQLCATPEPLTLALCTVHNFSLLPALRDDALVSKLKICSVDLLNSAHIIFYRRKMDEVHRRVLRDNLPYLQDNLSPEDVLDRLFAARIISADQLSRLKQEKPTKSCVRELAVYILPKAGSSAFAEFIRALRAEQHMTFIGTRLLEEEQRVQQRLCKGNSYA